jgi:hypothetical protein
MNNDTKKYMTMNEIKKLYKDRNPGVNDHENNMNVTFDSGNANYSLIGEKLANILNLTLIPIPYSTGQGVSGGPVRYTHITTINIKFNENESHNFDTSYDLSKSYIINAYVASGNMDYTLLLGQSSDGLKRFFDDKYCIYYDHERIYNERWLSKTIEKTHDYLLKLNDDIKKLIIDNSTSSFMSFNMTMLTYNTHLFNIDKDTELLIELYSNTMKLYEIIKKLPENFNIANITKENLISAIGKIIII